MHRRWKRRRFPPSTRESHSLAGRPAGNVDGLPERRRKIVYAAGAALVLLAVVQTAIVVAGGGYHVSSSLPSC
jgi:hypothetical protein